MKFSLSICAVLLSASHMYAMDSLLSREALASRIETQFNKREQRNLLCLNLRGLGLTNIKGLPKIEGIERIDLSRNQLTEVPAELFSHYPQLTSLNLSRNKLTQLPEEIGLCEKLIFLSLAK